LTPAIDESIIIEEENTQGGVCMERSALLEKIKGGANLNDIAILILQSQGCSVQAASIQASALWDEAQKKVSKGIPRKAISKRK
jgi:hypothetical protein